MFPVSAAYTTAIADPRRTTRITGSITLADGGVTDIFDDDIVMGSLYLCSQCVSADDIDVGSVVMSELGFTLKTDLENPYRLGGARVALNFGLTVGENAVEWVPLGYFYVNDLQRQSGKVALKCYDGLMLFDKPIDVMPTADTPYPLLLEACAAAKVTLGTGLSAIEAMPNGTLTLTPPDGDSPIKTWRDLLMWICQALAGFAVMNREGELEIRGYGATPQRSVEPDIRMRATAADTQVQVARVTMKLGDTTYSHGGNGMTMTLETNPLFGALDAAAADAALAAILGRIGTVQYVPATVEFNGDPALDPGDLVTLPATPAGDLTIPVMKSTWRYRGRHTIAAVGKSAQLRQEYSQTGKAVSAIAAAAATATQLAQTANQSTQLIHDAMGGHVLIRQGEASNEILIMDNPDPVKAVKIWRWNLNGLGYSANCQGADNPDRDYGDMAITMDGSINAKFVNTGIINSGVIFTGQLKAAKGSFAHLLAGKLDENGNPIAPYMKLGVDGSGDPFIDIFDDDGSLRSIRKDGDTFGLTRQSIYKIQSRSGMGTFIE